CDPTFGRRPRSPARAFYKRLPPPALPLLHFLWPGSAVRGSPGPPALADEAPRHVVESALEAIDARQRFSLVLSGGSTPRELHLRLAHPPFRDEIDWSRVHVFFGDERCVPPEDAQSNYRMAEQTLLSQVPIPHD